MKEHDKDEIPTIDREVPVASYKDWNPAETLIKVYRIDNEIYPGIFAKSREQAEAHCRANFGEVVEANYVPGRAFFRVRKPK